MVEILPPKTGKRLRLERGSGLDGLLGDLVFVAGRRNAEPILQQLHQRRTDLLLKFDDVAETLVLRPVRIEFGKKLRRPLLPFYAAVALDESKNGKFPFLRAAILGVGDRQLPHRRAVFDADDQQINLAAVEGLQASLQRLVRGGRFQLVKYGRAVSRQESVGVHQVLDDQALVFQFLLDRADKNTELL